MGVHYLPKLQRPGCLLHKLLPYAYSALLCKNAVFCSSRSWNCRKNSVWSVFEASLVGRKNPCCPVGGLKELLGRTLGNYVLTTEVLQTVLCDCESVINSRPLTYLSENSDDLVPLSPVMFLVENRNLDVADIDYRDTVNLRKRGNFEKHWAKVIWLIPGKDGKIRTVELKTRTGTMLRPIQRVYPLEVQLIETLDDPLNDCTFINPISVISSDML
ncbi:integrase catalytic domain-containing protein [Trichonephila clavipes]|uniref:Integrase catalytic domain-containing protein n=1 Tax=Trichonephila clavipes TaxID=2585209 RepID=A0A8X6RZZ6_TRICX|nr:integrase catalytic domain-containing protein [Trichonephila clavipes]